MLAHTAKMPSEKTKTSDRRRHRPMRSFHTSGIGIARVIESVRMLSAPSEMKTFLSTMHVYSRHQRQHLPMILGRGGVGTPGMNGCQIFSIGLHWKIEMGMMAIAPPSEMMPVGSTAHLMAR